MPAFLPALITPTGAVNGQLIADRLAQVHNVKDFGALGNSTNGTDGHDDTANIQAAINAAGLVANRGVIFFPPGIYRITSSLTANDGATAISSIVFSGVGDESVITGNFNGYLLKRGVITSAGGPNNFTAGVKVIENLKFINTHATGGCVQWCSAISAAIRNCTFSGQRCLVASYDQSTTISACTFTLGSGTLSGSFGILIGENGLISGCSITGFDYGIMFGGVGLTMLGNKVASCITGIYVGVLALPAEDGLSISTGAGDFCICGGDLEDNRTGIDFVQGGGSFYVGGVKVAATAQIGGVNPQYGIRLRVDKYSVCALQGVRCEGSWDQQAILVGNTSRRGKAAFIGVTAVNNGSGTAWSVPTTAMSAEFRNCNVRPAYTYAGLPTAAGSGTSGPDLLTGDRYYITDGNQATIGGNVTAGGGSNKSDVVWDGTNWKRAP